MPPNQVQPVDAPEDQFPSRKDRKVMNRMSQDAVVVRFARKRYGKRQAPVLDGLNMTVPRGCIYGLLGASGCGKTTLLSCVVGVRKLDDGEIWVLGGKPGQKDSGIPGPRVGYMPQDISLVGEFSIIGALYYFGRINGLEDSVIDERYRFYEELLDLPPRDRMVKNLSGGQQRRVSLAASLLHKPELLILDEPTVGLDPILRERIWDYLVRLTQEDGTTIIITTHYIEEAKSANKIGLMRCGQLLAETSPNSLLARFQCSSLEEAFLILSQKQKENQDKGIMDISNDSLQDLNEVTTQSAASSRGDLRGSTDCIISSEKQLFDSQYSNKSSKGFCPPISGKVFRALMIKNLLQFVRHPGGVLFAFIFPLIQVTLFFYAIGNDPKGIIVAVVNDEAGHCNNGNILGSVIFEPVEGSCDYVDISCRFLAGFDESIMKKEFFDSVEEATAAVEKGKAAGIMHFPRNFSEGFQARRDDIRSLSPEEIDSSEILTKLDMGDRQIGIFLQASLFARFLKIHADIVSTCNISRKYVEPPISFEKPIFGDLDRTYSNFVAPGFMLTICFFLATAVSSSIIIADRAEGVWDRSLVQGVTTAAILFSHILTQFLMIIIQVTVILSMVFLYFKFPIEGSLSTVIALVLLTGFCGMCYGFLISVFCTSHTMANFLSTGSFYPLVLLSGSIWPLEGMPTLLQWFSFSLPTTMSSLSLRGLMDKGSSLSDQEVYLGFIVTIGWTCIFVICCLIGLRIKNT